MSPSSFVTSLVARAQKAEGQQGSRNLEQTELPEGLFLIGTKEKNKRKKTNQYVSILNEFSIAL